MSSVHLEKVGFFELKLLENKTFDAGLHVRLLVNFELYAGFAVLHMNIDIAKFP